MNAPQVTTPVWHSRSPLGHLPKLARDPLALLDEAREKHGDVVSFRLLTIRCVTVSDPHLAHSVLMDRTGAYTKDAPGYRVLSLLLGQGLVTAEGEVWKRHRRIANPAFHRRCLEGFVETMNTACEDAVLRWRATGGAVIDLHAEMTRLTLRIAGETLFGIDLTDSSAELARATTEALKGFDRLVTNPLPFAHKIPTPANQRMKAALADLDRVVQEIISARRRSGQQKADLLGMLMDAVDEEDGTGLSDAELRDEVVTMLMAGHETTANALAWTLWHLGQQPDLARRATAELQANAPTGPIDFGAMGRLPWVKQLFLESLRLSPPVWMLERRCPEGAVLGGHIIPKGAIVMVSPWVLHRHPDHWVDAQRYDPERFSPERKGEIHPHTYLPFSVGARKCIGDRFAEAEAMVILGALLRAFELEVDTARVPVPDPLVTLRPGGGVWGRLRPL